MGREEDLSPSCGADLKTEFSSASSLLCFRAVLFNRWFAKGRWMVREGSLDGSRRVFGWFAKGRWMVREGSLNDSRRVVG